MKKLVSILCLSFIFALAACNPDQDRTPAPNENEGTGHTGTDIEENPPANNGPGNNMAIELEQDFTYVFAEGDWYKLDDELYLSSNFNHIENNLRHRQGFVMISNEAMYDKEAGASFTFVSFNPETAKLSLERKGSDDYVVVVRSQKPIEIITYENNRPVHMSYTQKSNNEFKNGYYFKELYTLPKDTLTSDEALGHILYNMSQTDVQITNNLDKINFREVFTWKKGNTMLLSHFLESYKEKDGERSTNPLIVDVFHYNDLKSEEASVEE